MMLGDCSLTLDDWHDGTLLDGRRPLKTICVDSAQELALEFHSIEAVGSLIVVRFDLAYGGAKVSTFALSPCVRELRKCQTLAWQLLTYVDILESFCISHVCDGNSKPTSAAL